MGLLGKIFGGGGGKKATATAATPIVECPHAVLVPRWENVQDMGIEAKATRWMCESCKNIFTPEEANSLRDTLAARVALDLPPAEEEDTPKTTSP
jgi:rubredoxin